MKTIQFILSLMAVALFASCSADSDVLNELEDHNQLPGDEMVTLSLNLSAGTVATKSDDANLIASDAEKEINSCEVIVLGQNGIELFNSSKGAQVTINKEEATASVQLGKIKKQALTIFVAANLDETDQKLFYHDPKDPANFTMTTKASALPKYNKVTKTKEECTDKIAITVKQLTSRIDYPEVNISNDWKNVGFNIENVSLQNVKTNEEDVTSLSIEKGKCAYVYPNEKTNITVTGKYINTEDQNNIYGETIFTFGPYDIKDKKGQMEANNIYKLVMTVQQPKIDGEAPSALGLDWFIAEMLEGGSINGEAGLN